MSSHRLMLGKQTKPGNKYKVIPDEPPKEPKLEKQVQRDDQAFLALQQYADFQAVLSKRLCDDLDRDEIYSSLHPQILLQKDVIEGDFLPQTYEHSPPPFSPANQLPSPVVIPVKKADEHGRRLMRAYAPSLMDYGINQNTFLHFIDTFNATIKGLPNLDIGDVTTLDPNLRQTISTGSISSSSNINACQEASFSSDWSSSFLDLANKQLFNPHGLHAMLKDSCTDKKAPTSIMDTDRLHSNPPSPQFLQSKRYAVGDLVFLEDYIPLPEEAQIAIDKSKRGFRQRRRRQSSPSTGTFEFPTTICQSPKRQFSGAVRGLFNGPRKQERRFMERVKSREAAKLFAREATEPEVVYDAPHLMIVNYPLDLGDTISNRDQKMGDSPPIYMRATPTQRQFRWQKDHCVPTL